MIIELIREKDIEKANQYRNFINSLVEEGAAVLEKKKISLEQAKEYLRAKVDEAVNKKVVFLFARDNEKIIARCEIYLLQGNESHTGMLRIAVIKGERGKGLGSVLLNKILKMAKTELKPSPKIIELSLSAENKRAMKLYKRFGFKQNMIVSADKKIKMFLKF